MRIIITTPDHSVTLVGSVNELKEFYAVPEKINPKERIIDNAVIANMKQVLEALENNNDPHNNNE